MPVVSAAASQRARQAQTPPSSSATPQHHQRHHAAPPNGHQQGTSAAPCQQQVPAAANAAAAAPAAAQHGARHAIGKAQAGGAPCPALQHDHPQQAPPAKRHQALPPASSPSPAAPNASAAAALGLAQAAKRRLTLADPPGPLGSSREDAAGGRAAVQAPDPDSAGSRAGAPSGQAPPPAPAPSSAGGAGAQEGEARGGGRDVTGAGEEVRRLHKLVVLTRDSADLRPQPSVVLQHLVPRTAPGADATPAPSLAPPQRPADKSHEGVAGPLPSELDPLAAPAVAVRRFPLAPLPLQQQQQQHPQQPTRASSAPLPAPSPGGGEAVRGASTPTATAPRSVTPAPVGLDEDQLLLLDADVRDMLCELGQTTPQAAVGVVAAFATPLSVGALVGGGVSSAPGTATALMGPTCWTFVSEPDVHLPSAFQQPQHQLVVMQPPQGAAAPPKAAPGQAPHAALAHELSWVGAPGPSCRTPPLQQQQQQHLAVVLAPGGQPQGAAATATVQWHSLAAAPGPTVVGHPLGSQAPTVLHHHPAGSTGLALGRQQRSVTSGAAAAPADVTAPGVVDWQALMVHTLRHQQLQLQAQQLAGAPAMPLLSSCASTTTTTTTGGSGGNGGAVAGGGGGGGGNPSGSAGAGARKAGGPSKAGGEAGKGGGAGKEAPAPGGAAERPPGGGGRGGSKGAGGKAPRASSAGTAPVPSGATAAGDAGLAAAGALAEERPRSGKPAPSAAPTQQQARRLQRKPSAEDVAAFGRPSSGGRGGGLLAGPGGGEPHAAQAPSARQPLHVAGARPEGHAAGGPAPGDEGAGLGLSASSEDLSHMCMASPGRMFAALPHLGGPPSRAPTGAVPPPPLFQHPAQARGLGGGPGDRDAGHPSLAPLPGAARGAGAAHAAYGPSSWALPWPGQWCDAPDGGQEHLPPPPQQQQQQGYGSGQPCAPRSGTAGTTTTTTSNPREGLPLGLAPAQHGLDAGAAGGAFQEQCHGGQGATDALHGATALSLPCDSPLSQLLRVDLMDATGTGGGLGAGGEEGRHAHSLSSQELAQGGLQRRLFAGGGDDLGALLGLGGGGGWGALGMHPHAASVFTAAAGPLPTLPRSSGGLGLGLWPAPDSSLPGAPPTTTASLAGGAATAGWVALSGGAGRSHKDGGGDAWGAGGGGQARAGAAGHPQASSGLPALQQQQWRSTHVAGGAAGALAGLAPPTAARLYPCQGGAGPGEAEGEEDEGQGPGVGGAGPPHASAHPAAGEGGGAAAAGGGSAAWVGGHTHAFLPDFQQLLASISHPS